MTETMSLEEYHADKRSNNERLFDYFWDKYKPVGIPDPECEVTGLIPNRKHRVDRFFRGARLVVEIDGGTRMRSGGRHNKDSDREKINLLTLQGYRVLRYSDTMLDTEAKGQRVVKEVAQAILQLKSGR
jgi:hypothetical protein